MHQGIRTLDELDQVVTDYMEFDELVVDVETMGPNRGDPNRNDVFWISLAGPGRCDVIPCGHPIGERVIRDPDDEFYRTDPRTGKHQEHRVNETTGRLKWVNVEEPFTEAPEQLWVSDAVELLRPLFFSKRRIVGHNVKFDVRSLAKYFGAVPPGPYGDTIVAAKLVNENEFSYALGDVIKREFHFQYEKIGKKGPELFPFSEAHLYSYLDSKYTWLLWEKLKPLMDREKVRHIFDLEMDLLPSIIDMENTGTPVDEDALDVLGREFQMEMARLKVGIDKVAGHDINLNANRQIAELIYDTLGKPCKILTPSGERSTAKATLEMYAKDKTVAALLEHAGLRKLQGTFVDGLKRNLVDGRVHPSFNQVGAVSGRISCKEPNIQQIPSKSERGKRVREVFTSSEGNVLVVADLSQIELRVLAHFTRDRQLLRAYRKGLDLHGVLAAKVFGADYTTTDRLYAKNGNFSLLYGASPQTLVDRYGFPNLRVAKQVSQGFYGTYTSVRPWKKQVWEDARRRYRKSKSPPYIETILGRKRRLPELNSIVDKKRYAAERQAISVQIQGSAADLFKVAIINCHALLQQQKWEGHILMQVHDELVVEVPEDYADEGLRLVKASMEDINDPFTGEPILSVPIVADAKVVTRWSDGK